MTLTVHPGPARGRVDAPPSKSLTHRALILAAVAGGEVERPLPSDDTRATRDALTRLGATFDGDETLQVDGGLRASDARLDCRNAGTAIRLLTGVCATLDGTTTLDGDASLRRRPMGPLVEALNALGADVQADDGTPPVRVRGPLPGGTCTVPGDVSSQFVSALILAGLGSRDGVDVRVEGDLVSRPYVDLTVDLVRRVGGRVQATGDGYRIEPSDLEPLRYRVEGDWSGAAFPLGLGALSGPVTVDGLDPGSQQGDRAILDHLAALGADVETTDGVTVRSDRLEGAEIDLRDTPDLFPVLACIACHADGPTTLAGAAHLRAKESDRIEATVQGIEALGGDAEPRDDGARISGGGLPGGKVRTRDDHRILMAFACAATRADAPVTLSEGESFTVSYPSFLDDLSTLGVRWTK